MYIHKPKLNNLEANFTGNDLHELLIVQEDGTYILDVIACTHVHIHEGRIYL